MLTHCGPSSIDIMSATIHRMLTLKLATTVFNNIADVITEK